MYRKFPAILCSRLQSTTNKYLESKKYVKLVLVYTIIQFVYIGGLERQIQHQYKDNLEAYQVGIRWFQVKKGILPMPYRGNACRTNITKKHTTDPVLPPNN